MSSETRSRLLLLAGAPQRPSRREYGLADRTSVYRHANALGLFPKRQRNIRAALERIIEQADSVYVTASSVVAAIGAYAKLNSAGEWIDWTETIP